MIRALALAVLLDATVGEPTRLHPVVGMGRLVDLLEARLPAEDGPGAACAAAAATGLGLAVVGTAAAAARRAPWPVRGAVLWTLLAGRMLRDEVAAVEQALTDVGVDAGRARIARLVSRDTTELTE